VLCSPSCEAPNDAARSVSDQSGVLVGVAMYTSGLPLRVVQKHNLVPSRESEAGPELQTSSPAVPGSEARARKTR